jgi:hypothetical protein
VTPEISVSKKLANTDAELTSNILNALDKSIQIVGIFCDLTHAFHHDILLDKLLHYGITIPGFKSYLENRQQRVEI